MRAERVGSSAHPRTVDAGAARLAVPVVGLALLVYGFDAGRPGLWRDEAATIAACRRSLPELLDLTRHVDLVHLAYYLIARTVWLVDPSVTAVRSISVLAMALTAGAMVAIGRRLGSDRIGVLTGLLLVVVPFASRFAQEARSFALVALVAAVLTWTLLGLLQDHPPRRRYLGYGVGLVVLGLLNVVALLLVPVHAVMVLTAQRSSMRLLRRWLWTSIPALVLLAPFALAGITQRGQISWMVRPGLKEPIRLLGYDFGGLLAVPVLVLALGAAVALTRHVPQGPARAAARLGAVWGILPPALLWLGSQLAPTWDYHYLLFSLPGLLLLIAALVPPVLPVPVTVLVTVLVVGLVGLPAQVADRRPDGHWSENLTAVADYLAPRVRPGDAAVFIPAELRVLAEDFPQTVGRLDDVLLVTGPVESGTLTGVPVAADLVEERLAAHSRVWLIRGDFLPEAQLPDVDRATLDAVSRRYQEQSRVTISDVEVGLEVRVAGT